MNELIFTVDKSFVRNKKDNYGSDQTEWNNRNRFIDGLTELGSKNKKDFILVKRRFKAWIKKYDLNFLHYQIQRLEFEYYSKVSENLTIADVIERLDKKEEIGTFLFWNEVIELKPNIGGIGINLNRLVTCFKRE